MDAGTLEKRLARERAAREQAESLLEAKSRELFLANQELTETSKTLISQSQQLNAIFEQALTAILLVDESGRIRKANRSAEATFGISAKDLQDRVVFELFQPDSQRAAREVEQKCVAGSNPVNSGDMQELTGARSDGTVFPVELAVSAVDLNEARHSVWICKDITARKEAQARQQQLEQELRQAQKLESLGTLASGIAHEINTPIQYINDNTHFLKESFADFMTVLQSHDQFMQTLSAAGGFDQPLAAIRASEEAVDLEFLKEEIPNSIGQTLDGIERISKIVTAVKEFSHPGTTEMTAIDLNKAIETTLSVTRNEWKYVAEVETHLDPQLPDVHCLPGDINQVIMNLVVNAAHAIEAKGGDDSGRISVATRDKGEVVEITVSDSGCGIPEEHRRQIFDPFFTTKGVGKGTGQGLSIAFNIINTKHQGTITFTTEKDKGTTFRILLPVLPSSPQMEAV